MKEKYTPLTFSEGCRSGRNRRWRKKMRVEDFIDVRRKEIQRNLEEIAEMREIVSALEKENRELSSEIERAERADKEGRWEEFQDELLKEME